VDAEKTIATTLSKMFEMFLTDFHMRMIKHALLQLQINMIRWFSVNIKGIDLYDTKAYDV